MPTSAYTSKQKSTWIKLKKNHDQNWNESLQLWGVIINKNYKLKNLKKGSYKHILLQSHSSHF